MNPIPVKPIVSVTFETNLIFPQHDMCCIFFIFSQIKNKKKPFFISQFQVTFMISLYETSLYETVCSVWMRRIQILFDKFLVPFHWFQISNFIPSRVCPRLANERFMGIHKLYCSIQMDSCDYHCEEKITVIYVWWSHSDEKDRRGNSLQ